MKLSISDTNFLKYKWRLVDLDKRETINLATSADDETGEYEVLVEESPGKIKMNATEYISEKKIGNIMLVRDLRN